MHTDLWDHIAAFVNDRDTRVRMGYDVDTCITRRVVLPVAAAPAFVQKLTNLLCHKLHNNVWPLQVYKEEDKLLIQLYMSRQYMCYITVNTQVTIAQRSPLVLHQLKGSPLRTYVIHPDTLHVRTYQDVQWEDVVIDQNSQRHVTSQPVFAPLFV